MLSPLLFLNPSYLETAASLLQDRFQLPQHVAPNPVTIALIERRPIIAAGAGLARAPRSNTHSCHNSNNSSGRKSWQKASVSAALASASVALQGRHKGMFVSAYHCFDTQKEEWVMDSKVNFRIKIPTQLCHCWQSWATGS